MVRRAPRAHARRQGPIADRLLWSAAATAPTGFAHLRAGMLGTLLEDVQASVPFETLRDKWAAKMDPTQYMRPQAAPTAGNIAAAEKIVGAIASAGALARRFARLDEVEVLWTPETPTESGPGRHLLALAAKAARPTPVGSSRYRLVELTQLRGMCDGCGSLAQPPTRAVEITFDLRRGRAPSIHTHV